jgi:photosystem II stability/assembly factor-like uncharacterized protein
MSWQSHALPPPASRPDLFQEYIYCESSQLEQPATDSVRILVDCYGGDSPDASYLYASDDGGDTWQARSLPVTRSQEWPYRLQFFDANQGLLLGKTIYRTGDGGRTWQRVRVLAWDHGQFSFVDPQHGWAVPIVGEETGLVVTSDGGSHWTEVEPQAGEPLALNEIGDGIQMVSPDVGWAQRGWGEPVLRTADGGRTWRDASPQLEGYAIRDLAVLEANTAWLTLDPEASDTISLARTTDGGATWTVLGGGLPPPVADIWFEDRSNGWIILFEEVAAGTRSIYFLETRDGGVTWVNPPFVPNQPFIEPHYEGYPVALAVGAMTGDQVYIDHARIVILPGILDDNPGVGCVVLKMTTDLGQTWRDLALPYPPGVPAEARAGSNISFFGGTGFLDVGFWQEDISEGSWTAIYFTQDGGSTWQLRPDIFPGAGVHFISAREGFLTSQGVLYATHDAAATWKVVNPLFDAVFQGEELHSLDFVSATAGWAQSIAPCDLEWYQCTRTWRRTTDGGLTWTRLTPLLVP